MSRFFNQSADEQNSSDPTSPLVPPDSGIDQLLEHLQASEHQQVVSVRAPSPALEELVGDGLKDLFPRGETAAGVAPDEAASAPPRPTQQLPVVSLPNFPGRLTGSDDRVFSRAAELLRMVRTRLLRAQARQRFRSVVITSASASEGKTLTTANLGLCCVQVDNLRVLLVDADLRTSGLSRLLNLPDSTGLADVLAGKVAYVDAVTATDVPRLHVIGAGQCTLPAAELLASPKFRDFVVWAGAHYDVVLVDSPPILAVADYELIAAVCEKIITVVLARRTKRALLEQAVKLIDSEKRLGTIFNASDPSPKDAYSQYAYYGYGNRPRRGTRE